MGLTVKYQGGGEARGAMLELVGDLDAEGGKKARARVASAIEAGCTDIAVNLDRVGFLDSSGLASLISALRLARARGGDVRIETSNERIRRVMEITALARVFKLQPANRTAA